MDEDKKSEEKERRRLRDTETNKLEDNLEKIPKVKIEITEETQRIKYFIFTRNQLLK